MLMACEPIVSKSPNLAACDPELFDIQNQYLAQDIDILPLTEFELASSDDDSTRLNIFCSLVDGFGCQIKSPGTFRFELFEFVPRSALPKGKRIAFWHDIDLVDSAKNDSYWKDHMRSYNFDFKFDADPGQTYFLQVTCICPRGVRLTATKVIKN
jgi:hypothetical protein